MKNCIIIILLTGLTGCGAQNSEAPQKAFYGPGESLNAQDRGPQGTVGEQAGKAIVRKIIYHATLDLVVEEFADVPSKVRELRDKFEAYIADSIGLVNVFERDESHVRNCRCVRRS